MRATRLRLAAVIGAVAVVLAACEGIVSIPDTSGITVYPGGRNQVLGPGEAASVSFDREVNRQSVEDIFLVEEAPGRLAGSYHWESRRVVFVPDQPYVSGRRYVVTFSGSFEDADGLSYTVHRSTPFYFGSSGEALPAVVSVTPPGGSTLTPTESVTVRFSTAVDPATLLRGISFTPSVDVDREVAPGDPMNPDPTGREVILRPRDSWKSFTVYTLTVSEEVKDLAGRPLAAEYEATFLAQEDATAPALLAAEATAKDPGASPPFSGPGSDITSAGYELLPDDVFRFTFSEAMDREATERALSFSPSVPGKAFWPSESVFVYVPDSPLGPGVDYTLILAAGATDRSGIPLSNPLSLQLAATLEWLSVTLELVEDGVTLTASQEDSATQIRPGLSPDFAYNIALTFSAPFETDADKLGLRQALRLSTLLSNDYTPPYLVGYSWPTNRQIRLTYHNVVPSTASATNYLLFSLPGGATGIVSSAGNQLKENLRVLLRPEAD